MKIRTYLVALAALAFGSTARADEGMWLLQLMKRHHNVSHRMGSWEKVGDFQA